MAFLTVEKGSVPGQILELHGERMVLGRHPSCQIVLDNAAVSRQHAQLLESHGQYYIEDLRSRNATLLNGKPVEGRVELHDNDTIRVCDVEFRFTVRAPTARAPNPKQAEIPSGPIRVEAGGEAETLTDATDIGQAEAADSDEDGEAAGKSSIISTLDAGSASSLRLDVKPEAKLRAVLGIGQAMAHTLDLDELLDKFLDGLFRFFSQADQGFVLLKDDEKGKLLVKATKTRSGDPGPTVRVSMTVVRQAMNNGAAILSADAVKDSRFKLSESLTQLQIRSMMCVPLMSKEGQALGVIQLDTKDLRRQFSQDDLDVLVSVASQASLAVENARLHAEMLKQRDLNRELALATQIQLGFLPNQPPKVPGYEFHDFYEAAERVGGDYFDYVCLPDGRVAVAVADVAGKGVPAALLMARLYSATRFHLLTKSTPAEAMIGLNSEISSSGLGHRFVTCVMVVVDPNRHEAVITNAGHMAPLRRNSEGEVSPLGENASGMPLGIVADQQFEQSVLPLKRGDTVVIYTDGIHETMRPDGELYGTGRLMKYIAGGPQKVKDLVEGIVADVEQFCRGRPQGDDRCLVAFRRI